VRKINTREQFKNYCLRKLGDGVLQVNITPEQLEDRIDDAIYRFAERHIDGTYYRHFIGQSIDGEITIPDDLDIMYVTRVIDSDGALGGSSSGGVIDGDVSYIKGGIQTLSSCGGGGIIETSLNNIQRKSNISALNEIYTNATHYEFNYYNDPKKITIQPKPEDEKYLLFEIMVVNDPDSNVSAWNSQWLQDYATALIQLQWANNLSKFKGSQLPGGLTFNVDDMKSDAKETLKELEHQLKTEFHDQPIGFIG